MNTRQKIREAKLAKWASLFKDQTASSLGVRDWCAQNNISIHAFYYWKRLVKEAYLQSVMPDIVPIQIEQCDSLPEVQQAHAPVPIPDSHNLRNSRDLRDTSSAPGSLTISTGDMNIQFGPSVPDKLIVSIIKAVRHA